MDILMGEDGMELGSAAPLAIINTSQSGISDVPNITFFPYYQHSVFVAASYIVAYLFIFLLCMVGNILVCLIVMENHRMRTVTNLFIFNLAISDLLVGIFCIPTTLVDNLISGWPFSSFMCKMSGFVQGVSVSASVFTLVAIAVERFRCIIFPLQPKPTVLVAKGAIMLIWVLAVVVMCPAAVVLTVEEVPFHFLIYNDNFNHPLPLYTCYENFANPKMRKVYTVVLFAHIYLVPLTTIALMYGSIGGKLYSSVKKRKQQLANSTDQVEGRRGAQPMISQKKIRVIKMLILVTLLFMLSWLPLWTLMMMADYANLDSDEVDLLTSYIFPFAHWLAFSNSSINPIIYGYYNENFKRGFQAVCKSRPFCHFIQCQLWKRMSRCCRKHRSVQAPCAGVESRGVSCNPNNLVLGLRNRVHNDNKLNETAEVSMVKREGCVAVHSDKSPSDRTLKMTAVHKKGSNGEEQDRARPQVSVYHAWDN